MRRDTITGLAVLAASLVLFWLTLGLERHPMVPVGPGFYPRIVLIVSAVLALALVLSDLASRREAPAARAERRAAPYHALVAAAFGVFALYVIALPFLGFRVATFVFLVAMQVTLEPARGLRRWAAVAGLAIVATAITYSVFESYLNVLLPRGRWTGL